MSARRSAAVASDSPTPEQGRSDVEATRLCKLRITFDRVGCAPASVTEKAHQSCSVQRAKRSHLSEAWTVSGEARAGEATSGSQRLQACDSRERSARAGVTARDAGKRKVGKLARDQGPAAPHTLSSPGGAPGTAYRPETSTFSFFSPGKKERERHGLRNKLSQL